MPPVEIWVRVELCESSIILAMYAVASFTYFKTASSLVSYAMGDLSETFPVFLSNEFTLGLSVKGVLN